MFILYHFIPCTITSKPVDESESRPGSKSMRLSTSSKLPFCTNQRHLGIPAPKKRKIALNQSAWKEMVVRCVYFKGNSSSTVGVWRIHSSNTPSRSTNCSLASPLCACPRMKRDSPENVGKRMEKGSASIQNERINREFFEKVIGKSPDFWNSWTDRMLRNSGWS